MSDFKLVLWLFGWCHTVRHKNINALLNVQIKYAFHFLIYG